MPTSVIDTALHLAAFPATYIGPGTLIGNSRQSAGQDGNLYLNWVSNGNAVLIPLGFRPLEIDVIDFTDAISWHWQYGFPAANALKNGAIDTTGAIVVVELAAGMGNWNVTLSAAMLVTAKNICFRCEG